MPDREVGGRFNPGGAPRGDHPRADAAPTATADAPLLLDFDDAFRFGDPRAAPSPRRPDRSTSGGRTGKGGVAPSEPPTAPTGARADASDRARTAAPASAPIGMPPGSITGTPATVLPDTSRARALATDATTADRLHQRLAGFGMRGISKLSLTHNRSTLISFRAGTLRLHAAFQHADEEVLRAVAVFVSGRGAARAAARRVIVAYEIPPDASPRPPRRARLHPDDEALAERLRSAHDRLNRERFGGALQSIRVTVSRRMITRLGHYAPARSHPGGAEIAISRRHIRRHGWREAFDTLLHEMVHQWQEESGHPIDHGPHFRRKAREVGTTPRARRVLR